MQESKPFSARVIGFMAGPRFFWGIVALLVLQAAWIALSGAYPMAFDEDFHLGLIRLYADHLSPFWNGQPAGADTFGAVARDPSYLYHYLMSFPYLLAGWFTDNQTVQVLILRAINIGFFAGGLVVYRRLLLKTGVSRALIHACLLVLVLLPVAPFLAAQINYDNLFLPLTGLALLMAVNFSASLAKRKYPDAGLLLGLVLLCLLISLVKYAFLPLLVVIFGFVAARLWQKYRSLPAAWRDLSMDWRRLSGRVRLGLLVALIVTGGLFIQRYGVNLARYHTPVPNCEQVLTIEQCSAYGPWIRDYNFALTKTNVPSSPLTFTDEWLKGMWLRTFFAVGGPATGFETRVPLFLPGLGAKFFAVIGGLALIIAAPRLMRRYNAPILWLFVTATVIYAGSLWLNNYQAYLRTGQPVAINGRYLLPVLPLILLMTVAAAGELIRNKSALKLVLATAVILCLSWGGGALTFILRSNDSWYWPSPAVRTANHAVQRTLGPLTPGYRHPTEFLP